ncbi:MAG TPA: cytochrome P460 family protein [Pyrinomonadaceae bacterium]|nr:cytochrome P460 family protein [Pyrinomonadaceae bacterium]
MRAARPASTLNFPQRTVMDGLPNVITTGNSTRVGFPRSEPPPDRSTKDDGRHETSFGFGYVNEVGRRGFEREPFSFPVGTVIVRERRWSPSSDPDRLVVMIKREKSFNRKANGWEFLTLSGTGTKILNREKNGKCLKCHASAAQNDFVFPMDKR